MEEGGEGGDQQTLFLNIGLSNGVMLRTMVDSITGVLADTRTRYLGSRPVKLFRIKVQGKDSVLALSSRPWYGWAGRRAFLKRVILCCMVFRVDISVLVIVWHISLRRIFNLGFVVTSLQAELSASRPPHAYAPVVRRAGLRGQLRFGPVPGRCGWVAIE